MNFLALGTCIVNLADHVMKSILLQKFGPPDKAFVLRDTTAPTPKSHQVRIAVEAFGLNFADVLARKGLYPDTPPLPCTLGYEVTGRVVEAGGDVPQGLVGKRVLALTRFGGYATEVVTDHRAVVELPDDMPAEKAVALGTQGVTAWICFNQRLQLRKGDRVLVHAGAGGVGNLLCQLALQRGCVVFATAGSERKIAFLRKLGVHHPIDYSKGDYAEAVRKALDGDKLDATFNSLAGKSFGKDMRLLGAGGTLVIFGAASRVGKGKGLFPKLGLLFATGFLTPLALIMGAKTVAGVNILKIGDRRPEWVAAALKGVVDAAVNGELNPAVGGTYGVEALNEAHVKLENRSTIGKLCVYWERPRH